MERCPRLSRERWVVVVRGRGMGLPEGEGGRREAVEDTRESRRSGRESSAGAEERGRRGLRDDRGRGKPAGYRCSSGLQPRLLLLGLELRLSGLRHPVSPSFEDEAVWQCFGILAPDVDVGDSRGRGGGGSEGRKALAEGGSEVGGSAMRRGGLRLGEVRRSGQGGFLSNSRRGLRALSAG